MTYVLIALVSALVAGVVGAAFTYLYLRSRANSAVGQADLDAKRIVEEAEAQKREMALVARDEALRIRDEMDREVANRRREVERIERRIEQKEE